MDHNSQHDRPERTAGAGRKARPPRPLDAQKLEQMALAYVARFATSAGKLSDYLRRKLRERGWEGDVPPDVAALVGRFVALGYVDDASFARGKAQGLMRRGYGGRRIEQALNAAGIAEPLREVVRGSETERRRAVVVMARKRRFGPFGKAGPDSRPDPAVREKQVAALLRAGHPLAHARAVVNAVNTEMLEEWIDDAGD